MSSTRLALLSAAILFSGCASSTSDDSTSRAAETASSNYRVINATTDPLYDRFALLGFAPVYPTTDGLTMNVAVVGATEIYLGVNYAGKSSIFDVGPWSPAFESDKITMPSPTTVAITQDRLVTFSLSAAGPGNQVTVSVNGSPTTVAAATAPDLTILSGIRGEAGTSVFPNAVEALVYETETDIVLQIGDNQTFPLGIPGESLQSLYNIDPQHWTLELTTDHGKYRIDPSEHVIGLTKE